MQKIPIKDLGTVGLIKDLDPLLVPPNGFTDVENMRIHNNAIQKVKGYQDVLGTMSDTPYGIFSILDTSLNPWFIYASETDIFTVDNNFTHREVTRVSGDYTMSVSGGDMWQGVDFSGIFIMNNSEDVPQSLTALNSTPTKFTDLPNWVETFGACSDTSYTTKTTCEAASETWTTGKAKVLRSFKNFLVAINVSKSSDYPYMVKWSHSADPGSVPSSWEEADATKDTGEMDLPEGGELVEMMSLGDANIIYSRHATHLMRYVGGQSVFSFSTVFRGQGILTTNCVAEFQNKHFVVTSGDVIVHDGRTYQSVIDKKLRDYLFTSLDADYYSKTYVIADPSEEEIWVCYPYSGSTYPNKALIWNWGNGAWSRRDIPDSTSMTYGPLGLAGVEGTFNGDAGTFDEDTDPMDYGGLDATKKVLVVGQVNTSNKGYLLDSTNAHDGTDFTASVQHEGIVFGDTETVSRITEVYPRLDVSGSDKANGVNIYLSGRMYPNATYTWEGPYNFDPASDLKIDCRVTGKVFAFKVESTDDIFWRLDGLDVKVTQVGSR